METGRRIHIGVASPIALAPLRHRFGDADLPDTISFPLIGHLVEQLVRKGHDVTVFAGSHSLTSSVELRGNGLNLFVVPMRQRRAPYDFYRPERAALAQAIQHSSCDLIHAHWTYEFAAAALDSGRPSLVTAHDSPPAILRYFILTLYAPFWLARSALGVRVLHRAHHITTVSPYCRDSIRRWIRPPASISVVPNGIESSILDLGTTRLAGGDPAEPFTLATVLQGFQERKNPKAAIAAFARVRRKFPTASMLMFGTDYEIGGPAAAWSKASGFDHGIQFLGKVAHPDLLRIMADKVHLLIHPAKEESFGMAPLEAMALGIPVIGGKKSGGVPYVLNGGETGALVNISSPDEIADAACRILENPKHRRHQAQAGWQRAASEFSLERMVSLYEQEYTKVLNSCPCGRK